VNAPERLADPTVATKSVAILQSNYVPWKGYFDLLASVDEFILYDDVQYTTRDWRNRNLIKTPRGREWLSIPVGADRNRLIREVALPRDDWGAVHLAKLRESYVRAPFWNEVSALIAPHYAPRRFATLSALNRALLEAVCAYLGITTVLRYAWEYPSAPGKTSRMVDLCRAAGATRYVSGPAAKDYLEVERFREHGIEVAWHSYDGYPAYPQLWGEFVHQVSILDLLFNCGRDATRYMLHA